MVSRKSKRTENIEEEISRYTNKILSVFKAMLLKLDNNNVSQLKQIKPKDESKKTQMSFELEKLIKTLCSKVENEDNISNEEKANLVFMLDCIFRPVLKSFVLPSLENNEGNGQNKKWLIDELRDRFGKDDFSFIRGEMIKNMFKRAVDVGTQGLENKNNKFNFETANLQSPKLLNKFDEYFADLKSKIGLACEQNLPNDMNSFEKIFDTVDCDGLIKFMYEKMDIYIEKCFLKKSIGALLYTNVEAVHGDDGNGDVAKVAERLLNQRNIFFNTDGYSGRDFIREATLFSKDVIDTEDKPLPKHFYDYDSDDQEKMFTVAHYIQAFWQSILARKEIRCCPANANESKEEHAKKFNSIICNINYNRKLLMFENDEDHKKFISRIRDIASAKYKNDPWGLPLAFLDILLKDKDDRCIFELDESVKKEICIFARDIVNFDLDLKSREHVTKLNLIEIEKDENDYINSNGEIVLPIANLFEEKAYARFFGKDEDEKIIYRENITSLTDRDELRIRASIKQNQSDKSCNIEEESYFCRLRDFVFDYMWNGLDWHNGRRKEIKTYRKVLMRIVVVLLLILLFPFVVVVTPTLYASYRLNLKIQLSSYKALMSLEKIMNAKKNISLRDKTNGQKTETGILMDNSDRNTDILS